MQSTSRLKPTENGFLLLEVLLALVIFGMACTGLTVALHQMGKAASLAQQELRIARILNSTLNEYLTFPIVEEGSSQRTIEGTDIKIDIEISLLNDLENRDGIQLQEMYLINVEANWLEAGERQSRSTETWRYNPIYAP